MKRRSNIQLMGRLIQLVRPLVGFMVLAVLMGVLGFLCSIFITILGGYAVLDAIGFFVPLGINSIFVTVLVFAILRSLLRYGEQACNHFIAFKLLALIRDKVFRALRHLCPAKLEGKEKGNLISIITSDIELLEVFYAHTISPIAIAAIMSVIMAIFIGSYHWTLGALAFCAYIVVGMVIPVCISRRCGTLGMEFRETSGELSGFVLDSLRGLKESIQYGTGKKQLSQLNKKTDALSQTQEKMSRNTGFNQAITNTVILVFDVAMLALASFLFLNHRIGFDGVLISTVALMSSFGPVIALANLGSTLQNTFAAGNRVLDLLDESPLAEEIQGKPAVDFHGAEINHLTFSYNDKENILSDISMKMPERQVVGIIGKSGSGKSTLLKLLMRFWKTNKGAVTISDTDIGSINTTDLRRMESYMTQETHLFHDSIENNIRIAKLNATHDEIVEACKKAFIHSFIMTLPNGYETNVGELGDTLSGGERQRLGLARVFLHNAPFILLDEPTSNLDSLNEAAVLQSLYQQKEDKTVVLVSHRESTMRIADTVYSVEHGRTS